LNLPKIGSLSLESYGKCGFSEKIAIMPFLDAGKK
jgi:hypothetical protein